jgi:hypothetical protein
MAVARKPSQMRFLPATNPTNAGNRNRARPKRSDPGISRRRRLIPRCLLPAIRGRTKE